MNMIAKCCQQAKQLYLEYTGDGRIDALYGPSNACRRAAILSVLWGRHVPQSKARWGEFRQAMLDLHGVVGTCIADAEAKLTRAASPNYDAQQAARLSRLDVKEGL